MFSFLRGSAAKQDPVQGPTKTTQQSLQETFIQEQQVIHETRAMAFINDYQRERQAKLDLIHEKIVANGIDLEEFLMILNKEKEQGVNVDFFTIDEIKAIIEREGTVQHDFSKARLSYIEEYKAGRQSNMFDSNINREDAASSLYKKSGVKRQTQIIKGTIFNENKHVVCQVTNAVVPAQVLEIPEKTLAFDIATHPLKWKVRRTPQDFVVLRDYLMKMYPQTLVPSLPYHNPRKTKLTQKQLLKKCVYYQRFLTCIMKSQILRSAEFLVEFLREADVQQFHEKVKAAKFNKGPEKLDEINTLFGDIEVNAGKKAKRFCRKMNNYITTYADITKFVKKRCKTLQLKSNELAQEYYAVATEVQRFSTLLQVTDIPQIKDLYEKLSQILQRNGDFILQSGDLINTQLSPWFKYHTDETQAYRDAKVLVDQSKKVYDEKFKELMNRKNQLFKKGDVKLWKVSDEHLQEAIDNRKDFDTAIKFMLPKETKECENRKEEWEFFTNQYHKEMKRVTMMNYDMGRELFVNLGEMMLRIIYQMNIGWQEFLQYYTGMNTERKEYDEKFLEEKGILEEAEPIMTSDEEDDDEEGEFDDYVPGILIPDEENPPLKNEWKIEGEWL